MKFQYTVLIYNRADRVPIRMNTAVGLEKVENP